MSEEQVVVSQLVVKCPKCREGHKPGVFHCTKCNTCLRPKLLGVITITGPILLTILGIASLTHVAQRPAEALVAFFINVAGILVLIALRTGKYWAWIAMHVLWVISIAFHAIQAIAIDPGMFVSLVIRLIVIVLFWIYFHNEKVKAFCSVGRPSI